MGFFRRNTESDDSSDQGKVIAFLNQKGGVGKTTLAFNMAHALAQKGKRVLCIDMDPQANFSLLFGKSLTDDESGIFQLLINSIRELKALHRSVMLSEVLQSCKSTQGSIDILPSGQSLSGFELSVAGISSPRQLILKKFLKKNDLLKMYDYIIIDGPPTLGLLVVNILCSAQGIFIPFQPDQFSKQGLDNFKMAIEDVEDMDITDTPRILGYIPNLMQLRRRQAQDDFAEITQTFQDAPIFEGFANKALLAKSSAMKKSVYDFNSSEYRDYQRKFSELASHVLREFDS